jgi:hypothetical protein
MTRTRPLGTRGDDTGGLLIAGGGAGVSLSGSGTGIELMGGVPGLGGR